MNTGERTAQRLFNTTQESACYARGQRRGICRWIGHMRGVSGGLSILLVLVALAGAGSLVAGEAAKGPYWPEFRGPDRDCMARSERGLLKKWPAVGPPLVWRSDACGDGYSSVVIAENRIYTAGDFGSTEMVIAFDLAGKVLWKAENGRSWRGATPGSRATPTYRDGILYHMNPTGRLATYRAQTGKEIWTVDLKERFKGRHASWALAESVAVDGERVFCVPGGSLGKIVALDRKTGKTLWANTELTDRVAYCSPLVITHKGTRQLITFLRDSVVSLDVRTGALLWQHEHESRYGLNVTTPLVVDGDVVVTSGYKAGARRLRIAPDSKSVKQLWWCEDLDNCHAGLILVDGYLYGSGCRTSKKGVQCIDYATGKVRWHSLPLSKVTPVWAEGLLYCLNYERTVSLVAPDPEQCRVISQFELPEGDDTTVIAYPVVCDGRLYIRHWNTLYVYDVRAKQ